MQTYCNTSTPGLNDNYFKRKRKINLVELNASRGMLSQKAEIMLDILGCR